MFLEFLGKILTMKLGSCFFRIIAGSGYMKSPAYEPGSWRSQSHLEVVWPGLVPGGVLWQS